MLAHGLRTIEVEKIRDFMMSGSVSFVARSFVLMIFLGDSCGADFLQSREFAQQCKMPGIWAVDETSPDGDVISLKSPGVLAATVTVTIESKNVTVSRQVPFTIDVVSKNSTELLRLRRNDLIHSRYTWDVHWAPGGRSILPLKKVVYALPYAGPAKYTVIQGAYGDFSHKAGSGFENAIDWQMPVGTKVYAARSGTVIAVKDDSSLGGAGLEFVKCANFVVIRHDDDTYGSYQHLRNGGVLVKVGDKVKEGDPIALSGDTGRSTIPHLHFDVFRNIDGYHRVTYPLLFKTEAGLQELQEGQRY